MRVHGLRAAARATLWVAWRCLFLLSSTQTIAQLAGGTTQLHVAAERGDLASIRSLLAARPTQINERDALGWTPLHHAVARSHIEAAGFLVDSGADVHARGSRAETALHVAVNPLRLPQPQYQEHPELTAFYQQLMRGQRSLSKQEQRRIHTLELERQRRMHRVPSFEVPTRGKIAALLISRGSSLTSTDAFGNTALHLAAAHQTDVLAKVLLDAGAALDPSTAFGWTPLHRAAESGSRAVVRLLAHRGANIVARLADGRTPLHVAVINGHELVVSDLIELKALLNDQDGGGWTPLHHAAVRQDPLVAQVLLKYGAALDVRNRDGFTPLHNAAERGLQENAAVLLDAGADPNSVARDGRQSILLSVARLGHREVAELLIEKGASLAWQDHSHGVSALHNAAQYGQVHIVELFLRRGANPLLKDRRGDTPLHYAANWTEERAELRRSDLRNLEVESAADPNHVAVIQLLLKAGSPVDVTNKKGQTPLHYAAHHGNVQATQYLLQRGSNPDVRDDDGYSATGYAELSGHTTIVDMLRPIVRRSPSGG